MNEQDTDKALKTADQIITAVVKKFPKYHSFVRRYESGDAGYIELTICPEGGGKAQEISTAYSDEYFLSVNKDNISEKAKRILSDYRIILGVKNV